MKKLLFVFPAMLIFTIASAQIERKVAPRDTANRSGQKPAGEYAGMFKDLNLTPEQKIQLKAYVQETQEKLEKIKADTKLLPAEKRSVALGIRNEQQAKIASMLTPEQRAKMIAAKQKLTEQKAADSAKKSFDGVNKNGPL